METPLNVAQHLLEKYRSKVLARESVIEEDLETLSLIKTLQTQHQVHSCLYLYYLFIF